jgi:hypothetical protein
LVGIFRFRRLVNFFELDTSIRKFRCYAKDYRGVSKKRPRIILVEHRRFYIDLLALLAFLPPAVNHFNANIIFYEMSKKIFFNQIKRKFKITFSLFTKIVSSKFLFILANDSINNNHQILVNEFFSGQVTKQKFENFSYRGILLGDLIYDFYLRKYKQVTLDVYDLNLKSIMFEYMQYTDKFFDVFNQKSVAAVVVSHSTYGYGIPARIAASLGIEAFLAMDILHLVRINMDNMFPATQNFVGLPERFKLLTTRSQEKAITYAREKLDLRLNGDTTGLRLAPPLVNWKLSLLPESVDIWNKKNVCLVALHDFVDAPHRYGNNFYPDFWEWVLNIGHLTRNSNFIFLLKPHPYSQYNALQQLKDLCKQFPHFYLISGATSHDYLIKNGVTHCLTVHGHIASEMACKGIVTINSAKINPHMNYNFCYTPNSLEEFELAIQNLKNVNIELNLLKVQEFYFVHHLFNMSSWIIPDTDKLYIKFGTARIMNNTKIFDYYLNSQNKVPMSCLHKAVSNFLKSNDIKIERWHYNQYKCSENSTCICDQMYSLNGIIEYRA